MEDRNLVPAFVSPAAGESSGSSLSATWLGAAFAAMAFGPLLAAQPATGCVTRPESRRVSAALAARPHMVLPTAHWTYDAMTELDRRGIETGFSNEAFSGKVERSRREFARGVRGVLSDSAWSLRAGTALRPRHVLSLLRLTVEFGPELVEEGVDHKTLQRVQHDLKEFAGLRVSTTNPFLQLRAGRINIRFRDAESPALPTRENGAARAAAEWEQGLVLLYSLDPLPPATEAYPLAIPWVQRRDELESAGYVAGHNSEVWRRLRELGPPQGTSLSWLGDLFNLKRTWGRSRKEERVVLKGERFHPPEDSSTTLVLKRPEGTGSYTPPSSPLVVPAHTREVELEAPLGLRWAWSRQAEVEVLWGRPGTGVVYLRARRDGKSRIYAYDIRTGWLLNAAEG